MPEQPPRKTNAQPEAVRLGVTEIIFLLGLVSLATGIGLLLGSAYSLIVIGALLLATAFINARERGKGSDK